MSIHTRLSGIYDKYVLTIITDLCGDSMTADISVECENVGEWSA
jgi:hypothetical protein